MPFPKKELYIPIEIKPRELLSRILLGGIFAQNHYRVYIASKTIIDRAIKHREESSGTYFFKSGSVQKDAYKVRDKVELYCVLDEEIGVAIKDADLEAAIKIRAKTISTIDFWFSASNHITSAFREVWPDYQSRVITTGWPKFDLWKKRFEHIYEPKSLSLKQKYGSFILFSSDFGFLDNIFLEKEIKKQVNQNIKNSLDSSGWTKRCRDAFKDFNLFCEDLISYDKLPHCIPIIIRPHPGENQHVWYQRLNGLKNIKVIYEGEISEWLHASKALLHRGCTTSVQAALSGKPCFFWNPTNSNSTHEYQLLPYALSVKVESCSDLLKNHNIWKKDGLHFLPIENTSERICFPEKQLSSELIFETVNNKASKRTDYPLKIPLSLFLYAGASQLLLILVWKISLLRILFSSHRKIRKLQNGIHAYEVNNYLDKFFPGEDLIAVEIAPGLVCIEKT